VELTADRVLSGRQENSTAETVAVRRELRHLVDGRLDAGGLVAGGGIERHLDRDADAAGGVGQRHNAGLIPDQGKIGNAVVAGVRLIDQVAVGTRVHQTAGG